MASELIVEFHSGGGDMHRAALIDWAHSVGYTRVRLTARSSTSSRPPQAR
jgi:hypothetical protein